MANSVGVSPLWYIADLCKASEGEFEEYVGPVKYTYKLTSLIHLGDLTSLLLIVIRSAVCLEIWVGDVFEEEALFVF